MNWHLEPKVSKNAIADLIPLLAAELCLICVYGIRSRSMCIGIQQWADHAGAAAIFSKLKGSIYVRPPEWYPAGDGQSRSQVAWFGRLSILS